MMSIYENVNKLISISGRSGMRFVILAATAIGTYGLFSSAKPDDAVPYPTGYRQWAHVKSSLIGPKHADFEKIGGFQHIYANEKAMEGYRAGRFPDGSVLVDDFIESRESASHVGLTYEGPRRFTAVMVKDSKRYAETGGWGWEEFKGDSQTDRMVGAEAATKCFACHGKQKDHDSVFSTYRK